MHASAAALAAGLLLTGCADTWFGIDDTVPLPGERVPVMLLEDELAPDPRLLDIEVRLPPPQVNPEWPQSGGLPHNAMHHLAAADELTLAWRVSIGRAGRGTGSLLARPVVAGGRVFTMDSQANISAFDVADGRSIWQYRPDQVSGADGLLGGGLATADGRLFATLSSGVVVALEAATGTEIWRQALMLPLRAAPSIADGLVLVLTADNQLYALDAATGRPVWRHAGFVESAGLLGGPSPAIANGIVIVPYSSAEVYALRLDTGRPLWNDTVQRPRRTLALAEINDIDGNPVVDGERVLVAGHGGQMAALDLRRGVRAWDLDLASRDTPWIAGDFVYVLTTRNEVVCLLRNNGRVRWVSPLPRFERADDPNSAPVHWSGPILVGDRLLLAGSNGQMVAVSPYNGEILGRINVSQPVHIPPVAAGGTVFVVTSRAELLAFR
jgi:outer membrane protein assembly factor BamB